MNQTFHDLGRTTWIDTAGAAPKMLQSVTSESQLGQFWDILVSLQARLDSTTHISRYDVSSLIDDHPVVLADIFQQYSYIVQSRWLTVVPAS